MSNVNFDMGNDYWLKWILGHPSGHRAYQTHAVKGKANLVKTCTVKTILFDIETRNLEKKPGVIGN
jgi:hypothetical protein